MASGPSGRQWWLLAALLAGNMALATGPYFVRLAESGPVAAGFWRLFLALPFLLLFARGSGEAVWAVPRAVKWIVALAGAAFALDLASWHIGIEMTRLGNATLFGNSGSLVLLVWGFVIGRRLPRGGEWLAIIFALTGAAILLGGSLEISTHSLVGDLFCLMAGMFYAVYLLILQRARATLGSWSLLVWVCLAGAPIMLAIALLNGEPVWPPMTLSGWTPLVALFVTSQIIGQGLLVFSLRHFPPLIIGLALLTQPAMAALIGWSAFGEVLSVLDILGMILLGTALAVARSRQGR
ncbi:MAG: DMT family transporter [Alteripontixanthobacter sp.]